MKLIRKRRNFELKILTSATPLPVPVKKRKMQKKAQFLSVQVGFKGNQSNSGGKEKRSDPGISPH
jgi:hypothetical protein